MNNVLKILDQVGQVKIKSITGRLFHYALILFAFGLISAVSKVNNWITVFLFVIGSIILIFGLIFYAYFAMKNPDFLRSETYQLRKQSLELIGDKDNFNNPNIDNARLISTSPYDLEENNKENKRLG